MFESIIVRKHADGQQSVDAGIIAETLLFYDNVHVLADRGVFGDLLRAIGPDNLIRVLDMKAITLSYIREIAGVYTDTRNDVALHKLVTFIVEKNKDKKPIHDDDDLMLVIESVMGKTAAAKKFAKAILPRIEFRRFGGPDPHVASEPLLQARADLQDASYVKTSIGQIIHRLVPDLQLPDRWSFEILNIGDDFAVGTDLDLSKLNEAYHRHIPPTHSSLTPAYLVGFLLHARLDLYFSASYMAELVTSDITSAIIAAKFRDLLAKRHRNEQSIEAFQNLYLNDSRAIREAINSGERSFTEFLALLEKAKRFKAWLGSRNPDANLLREYYKETTSKSWIDNLPPKIVRFALTVSAGIGADLLFPSGGLGTLIGTGIGGADTFLLDKIVRGWRPNQFVENELRDFASPSKE